MDGNTLSSPTPFTPPTTEEDRLAWLRLIRSRRVGPSTFLRLMSEHDSVHDALDALPAIARAAGVADYAPCPADMARREIEAGLKAGARLVMLGMPDYPLPLAAIPDPPPVLWLRGRAQVMARPGVALVGARNASSLGARMTRRLAEGLGYHGYCVVSGLARGIDTVAHGGALKTGTIAVMAGGVDVIYPAENAVLGAAIADQGLLVSEQPVGLQPQARHFPRRNRLIAGLSRAVIVVEAAEGSGSLITARDALDQGREVMAVPGHPMDARAAGCNALLREGARLVRGVEDIIDALNEGSEPPVARPERMATEGSGAKAPPAKAPPAKAGPGAAVRSGAPGTGSPPDMLTLHRMILDRLGAAPVAEDQLLRDLDLPHPVVAPALLFLELDGRVQRQPGGMLARI
ncbi:DNA-processing protein DprA [Pararhodobacter marinus]|uniref:DNA-protecting protein DprA n=1 Tax=Pararhodobacter marinus TaxID=2184063 RepID=A0A2U2C7U9_9RHOB|nr:DNA-processing protein DprA [Pararhodobacter marinus]PWE27933.1 DNA-protecting protein DprA [Pararhodobacter marinus]